MSLILDLIGLEFQADKLIHLAQFSELYLEEQTTGNWWGLSHYEATLDIGLEGQVHFAFDFTWHEFNSKMPYYCRN